jgi:hypothetical protein
MELSRELVRLEVGDAPSKAAVTEVEGGRDKEHFLDFDRRTRAQSESVQGVFGARRLVVESHPVPSKHH